jgi:putative phosphoesterase
MLNLAIVSDTHWSQANFDLERLQHRLQGADYIVHAGDAVSLAVLEGLERVAPLLAVAGNCCQQPVRSRFGWEKREDLKGLKIALFHGHLVDLTHSQGLLERYGQEQLLIHGHTHLARCEEHQGRWIFNPGSVSEPRYGTPASYGWAQWDGQVLKLEHLPF